MLWVLDSQSDCTPLTAKKGNSVVFQLLYKRHSSSLALRSSKVITGDLLLLFIPSLYAVLMSLLFFLIRAISLNLCMLLVRVTLCCAHSPITLIHAFVISLLLALYLTFICIDRSVGQALLQEL